MNYRHAYHAGNFADVLKHVTLSLVIEHMKQKDAPFRYVDTHAGVGVYELGAREARATGEWEAGVGRFFDQRPTGGNADAFAPWFQVLDLLNPNGRLERYPGSPEVAHRLLRPKDSLVLCELHPDDGAILQRRYRHDPRVKVSLIDGWHALGVALPPKERRGIILMDPPYEAGDEFVKLSEGFQRAHRRFATGTYLLWYPVKGTTDVKGLTRALTEMAIPKTLKIELHLRTPNHPQRLDGAGLIVVNPPWTLPNAMRGATALMAERMATGPGARGIVEWIVPES